MSIYDSFLIGEEIILLVNISIFCHPGVDQITVFFPENSLIKRLFLNPKI